MGMIDRPIGSGQGGGEERFRTAEFYVQNRTRQLSMSPQTVAQLRTYGVTEESRLKLEYFFYTNTQTKAAALAEALAALGYVGGFAPSTSNQRQFVVTGWTTRIQMDTTTVLDWTGRMCDIGREHDCEFDGWGTHPDQEDGR